MLFWNMPKGRRMIDINKIVYHMENFHVLWLDMVLATENGEHGAMLNEGLTTTQA